MKLRKLIVIAFLPSIFGCGQQETPESASVSEPAEAVTGDADATLITERQVLPQQMDQRFSPSQRGSTDAFETRSTTTPAALQVSDGKTSVGMSSDETIIYKQRIATTLQEVLKSPLPSPKARGAAEAMARDLELELQLAANATTPEQIQANREALETGLKNLSDIASKGFEEK